jgi:hypothetical protein
MIRHAVKLAFTLSLYFLNGYILVVTSGLELRKRRHIQLTGMITTMISSRLPHTLRRTAITSKSGFAASIRNRQQTTTRRSYAEAHYHERKKGRNPWYDDFRFCFNAQICQVLTMQTGYSSQPR